MCSHSKDVGLMQAGNRSQVGPWVEISPFVAARNRYLVLGPFLEDFATIRRLIFTSRSLSLSDKTSKVPEASKSQINKLVRSSIYLF